MRIVRLILSPERVALWDRCYAARYTPTRMYASDWKKNSRPSNKNWQIPNLWHNPFMNEDDRDFTQLDPANLLPFECILEPENPAIRIPSTFIPSEPLPVDNRVFVD